jgi:putative ABC transport system ATP-binding protein
MIRLDKIEKIYNKGKSNEFQALYGVDFSVEDGELVAIVGTSGAGKSTLLHILACIDRFEAGEYRIDEQLVEDCSEKQLARIRNEKIGMVMQDYALIDDFTAIQNVMLPLDFSKKKIRNKKQKALNALEKVGMRKFAKNQANKLSGGQKQRVAIARAIVNQPSIILADEPTGALDSNTSAEIMELFHELHASGMTVIIVTHNRKVAEQCDRIVRIEDGRVCLDS